MEKWIKALERGESLWIDQLRQEFERLEEPIKTVLRLCLPDGSLRELPLPLPRVEGEREQELCFDYLSASVFNLLSAYGGRWLEIYTEKDSHLICALLPRLEERFMLREKQRSGYGKCINVADRISTAFGGERFELRIKDIAGYAPIAEKAAESAENLGESLKSCAAKAEGLCCCGVDVGGTDVKLALSVNGELVSVKEFDWNPAESPVAEGYTEPIVLLSRLMRARAAAKGELAERLEKLMEKDAPLELIEKTVNEAEAALGESINVLDALGLSFPDVVIENRIVGGETPKTKGMRENTALDYEKEFLKIGLLKERLEELCKAPGCVHITNDGNMAAFTAAMELAMERPEEIGQGVIAHSLGTDFGSGWLDEDGKIPPLALEMYDFLLDLGSRGKQSYELEDLRSVRNENSTLPGARRYLGQAGVFRMAYERKAQLLDGFTQWRGDTLVVPTAPGDLRKPCLEKLMQLAAGGEEDAEQVFVDVGRNLGHMCLEIDRMLKPKSRVRYLFGRFVKNSRCFELICRGCGEIIPGLELKAADDALALTPLMKQLARRTDVTVAQFAQAVGAVYYALQQSRL